MTILSERQSELTAKPSRALRYLPLTALSLDIVVLAWASVIATLGRERLGLVFGPAELSETVGLIGPFIVLGWLAAIGVFGGYQESAFSVGTDEFKRVLNASLLTAGLVGVGCYLAQFQLSRGFYALEFLIGIPLLLLGRLVLRRVAAPRPPCRDAVPPGAHRRDLRPHRRDRPRAQPRVVAGLPRGRRRHPAHRRPRGNRRRRPGGRQRR